MAYDLVIRNGTIVDGTGAPRRAGAVAIQDGVIQAVGDVSGDARRVVDAHGHVVAPGFIDPHTHLDFFLRKYPAGLPVVQYGVTTVVIADCGASCAPLPPKGPCRDILMAYLHRVMDEYVDDAMFEWTTYEEYLDYIEGRVGINVAAFVPHSPIRLHVMGEDALKRQATADELAAMVAAVESGWRAGAIGFSSSPVGGPLIHADTPSTLASREEMLALANAVGQHGGIIGYNGMTSLLTPDSMLADVTANLSARMLLNEWAQPNAKDEVGLQLGDRLAELNATGHPAWGVVVPYRHIRNVRAASFYPLQGVDAWDALPKEAGPLAERLRDPDLRTSLRAAAAGREELSQWHELTVKRAANAADRRWEGRTVADAARETGQAPIDFALDLLQRDDGSTRFALFGDRNHSEEILGQMIASPHAIIGTDAGAHLDRFYWHGAPARILGYWSREKKLLGLEEAVHKLTGVHADILNTRRGRLEAGRPADVVVFDPDTIDDGVLPRLPYYVDDEEVARVPRGIDLTVVNGEIMVEHGDVTEARPGKVRRWEL